MKIIAVYGLTNTASVNIYDIQYGIDDEVLAGVNNEKPEWCTVQSDGNTFKLGELEIPLNECMRI